MKKFTRNIFHHCAVLFSRSALIVKVAQRIVDYRKGNNNPDMTTNGEFYFLKKHAGEISVAFDIGANQGDWTRAALGINSQMRIVAFEPDPAIFAIFQANRFPKNVMCENQGMGSKKGDTYLIRK